MDLAFHGNSFRFLYLPAEVRNQIYKILLVQSDEKLWLMFDYDYSRRYWPGQSYEYHPGHRFQLQLQPQLLQVCRQIEQEAKHTLYGSNTFTFPSLESAGRFVADLHDCDNLKLIRAVSIQLDWRSSNALNMSDIEYLLWQERSNPYDSCYFFRPTIFSRLKVVDRLELRFVSMPLCNPREIQDLSTRQGRRNNDRNKGVQRSLSSFQDRSNRLSDMAEYATITQTELGKEIATGQKIFTLLEEQRREFRVELEEDFEGGSEETSKKDLDFRYELSRTLQIKIIDSSLENSFTAWPSRRSRM